MSGSQGFVKALKPKTRLMDRMSKKLFKQLVKRASTPIPKEADKQLHPESFAEKQTRSHKT